MPHQNMGPYKQPVYIMNGCKKMKHLDWSLINLLVTVFPKLEADVDITRYQKPQLIDTIVR
jgi:hypothetical protein